jgi:hypothetical protein
MVARQTAPAGAYRGWGVTAATKRRRFAPAIALCAGLALSGCTSFANTVSDHWPTWAGGMPKDVPPRPGAPGYEEFLSHQQGKDAAPTAANASATGAAQPATTAALPPSTPGANPPPATAVPAPASAQVVPSLPPAYRRTDDQGVVQGGGLY